MCDTKLSMKIYVEPQLFSHKGYLSWNNDSSAFEKDFF